MTLSAGKISEADWLYGVSLTAGGVSVAWAVIRKLLKRKVSIGLPVMDPIIGLIITAMVIRITWPSWLTIRRI